MPGNLTIITFFIDAVGIRNANYTGTSATENIRLDENALSMGPDGVSQPLTNASDYSSLQAPTTTESAGASNLHNRSEGSRIHTESVGSEQSFGPDIEAQIEDSQSTDDSSIPSVFFRRWGWGKHVYAGVAVVLLLLHIVRSVYSGTSGSDESQRCKTLSITKLYFKRVRLRYWTRWRVM
jgi:hypothetical protein